jgi:anti-sigma factor RsiW
MMHPDQHFSAYLDGELDAGERQAVEVHLAECETCSEKLSKLRRLSELLGSVSSLEPSSEFSQSILQRIEREDRTRKVARSGWAFLGVAAAIVLLILILRIQQDVITPSQLKKPKTIVVKPGPEKMPVQKPAPPKEPIVVEKKPAPIEQPDEKEEVIAELKPQEPAEKLPEEVKPEEVQPEEELTSEEVELIANLDELENMDLIANYDQLQNLDIALISSDEERKE